jgi:formylglycine-generating enzyme required for sulfatase activity
MKQKQAARVGGPSEKTAGIATLEAFGWCGAPECATRPGAIALAWAAALVAIAMMSGCSEKNKAPEPADAHLVKTACGMEMVNIPGGELIMGANDGPVDVKPAHRVKVDGFLMDQTLVTQNVYQKIMGTNPSRRKNPNNPVEQASWTAAVKFCNARSIQEGLTPCYDLKTWACNFAANGYRLPTEAEWEYACRAATTTKFFFGDNDDDLKSYGWFQGNSESKTHVVGRKKPNPWGLYDMAGNLWEWCNDYYGPKYYQSSPSDNPRGPQQGEKRVLRGGAWSSSPDNCASWARGCDEAGATDICLTMDSNGFRCVRKK